ncbi:uncharacterized protein [Nicotiana sylvestris]|uniref:uncharacterized protein n=1 Tax=Nicotiana sylvestris TaxID=4096 RepID=UPI00388CEC89
MWRALRNKLPTDDRVLLFSNPAVSRCVCYTRPTNETVDHIFSRGSFVSYVWRKYGGIAGIQTDNKPLNMLLMNWWMQKSHNEVQKLILDIIPIIIRWNIWKNRCSAKYEGKASSMARVLFSINSDVSMLLRTYFSYVSWPFNWNELYPIVEQSKYHTSVIQVIWQRPKAHFVKVKNDGSALSNPSRIEAGVIIRDHTSELTYAIATPFGEGTNNLTEVEAAIIGGQWCLDNGFHKVHLEADQLSLSNS